jgi:beta-xylosidase
VLRAGIDVELPHTSGYGEVPSALLDRAALRVLTQKAALGLLDPNWKPDKYQTTQPDYDSLFNSPHKRAIARRIAEESVVLLDNPEGLLPPVAPHSIAVI